MFLGNVSGVAEGGRNSQLRRHFFASRRSSLRERLLLPPQPTFLPFFLPLSTSAPPVSWVACKDDSSVCPQSVPPHCTVCTVVGWVGWLCLRRIPTPTPPRPFLPRKRENARIHNRMRRNSLSFGGTTYPIRVYSNLFCAHSFLSPLSRGSMRCPHLRWSKNRFFPCRSKGTKFTQYYWNLDR